MKKSALFLLSLSIMAASCTKEEDDTDTNTGSTTKTLSLNISNLEAIESNERYEGWVIVDGAPVSTGLFTVDQQGVLSETTFEIPSETLDAASAFVLSIEPFPDTDPAPSAIKILGGAFNSATAMVNVEHMAALGSSYNTASATYILATPTTTDMSDELSGVWFLDNSSGSPMQGLNLPTLPSTWVYEGWAVINGMPISTGRFTALDMQDDAANFSGMDATGPPYPGEDFVQNAPMGLNFPTDLTNATIVISIEPEPDNSPKPFAFKPLVSMPSSATSHTAINMTNQVSTNFPSGTVSR